jgi:hypothetical protein
VGLFAESVSGVGGLLTANVGVGPAVTGGASESLHAASVTTVLTREAANTANNKLCERYIMNLREWKSTIGSNGVIALYHPLTYRIV